jgi:hypothetical protein
LLCAAEETLAEIVEEALTKIANEHA